MIASSGILSNVIMYFLNKQVSTSLISTMMTSLTMSITFLLYGLYNRNTQYQAALKEIENKKTMYIQYLEDEQVYLSNQRKKFETQVQEYIQEFTEQYKTQDHCCMYVGNQTCHWCSFIPHTISYENRKNELILRRQNLIDTYIKDIKQPYFVQKGSTVWLNLSMHSVYDLFEHYLWYTKDSKKVVWIGSFRNIERVLLYEACIDNGKFLYSNTDKINMQERIVFTTLQNIHIQEAYALIYVGMKQPHFAYDIKIEDIDISPLSKKKKRILHKKEYSDFLKEYITKEPVRKKELCLSIPIGTCQRDVFWMNLKKTGSHGLVAGMTGSGKSEFLCTLLMMLIWNNSSKKVQYILIDFKGGAFGQPFYHFAHCAGIVTNLNQASMNRFFQSMMYELEKRQRLFLKTKCKDIDMYNQKFEMSHLWIIVDEFAQLKAKYPQMMSQLQEIARIGRSLGVHLILSTQKPLGVVDDQIWANTNWKACFHVGSKQDSREVLLNEEAYHIENPGEMIFQEGNQFFHIQSFYLRQEMGSNFYREIDIYNHEYASYQERKTTFMDEMEKKLLAQEDKREWIILPKVLDDSVFGKIDMPQIQRQDVIEFQHINVIYTKDKSILYSLFHYFENETIYVCKNKEFEIYADYYFEQYRYLDVIGPGVCFLFTEENVDLNRIDSNCIVFVIINKPIQAYKEVQSVFMSDIKSMDEKRNFFDTYHLPEFSNLTFYEKEYYEFFYRKVDASKVKQRRSKNLILKQNQYRVGFDILNDMPVFLDPNRKFYILYTQNSALERIEKLEIEGEILHVDESTFEDGKFTKNLSEAQLLWVGYGIKEYGYFLKRKIPYENYDMIFFKDEEGRGIIE